MDLGGKVAVVTGAGSGLGRAAALALAAHGADVVVAGLDPPQLETGEGLAGTAAAIEAVGRKSLALEADISDPREVAALAAGTADAFGGADILVNNAAVYPTGPWTEVEESEWDRVFAVNARGYFTCCKAFHPHMKSRGGGSIVSVSSITFFVGVTGLIHYASSKGAVVGLTRALAREVGPENIRVNAIAPGAFPTRAERLPGRDLDKLNREVLEAQALKRRGTPEDVAGAVVFLASDLSGFITGQTLLVDGGWYLH
jgi:3-oxoacyl-[acyl-carrier protein] reductase